MKANWTARSGSIWEGQKVFIVSNYHPMNEIVTWGFKHIPRRARHDIGMWKIKSLKN